MRHVTGAERSFFRRTYGRQDIPSRYAPPGRPDADFEEAEPAMRPATWSAWSRAAAAAMLFPMPGSSSSRAPGAVPGWMTSAGSRQRSQPPGWGL